MKWSLLPIAQMAQKRLLRREAPSLQSVAERQWEIAPAERTLTPRAFYLPDQVERVTGWAFRDTHPRRDMEGSVPAEHAATRAALIRDAWLIDGVVYKGLACSHLHRRTRRWPELRVELELDRAALFCAGPGNHYFGNWLMDDCPAYRLAIGEGEPVTTAHPPHLHTPGYESFFDMAPRRLRGAFFRELVVFEDNGQNRNKHLRFRALGEAIAKKVNAAPHPGVFLVRGGSGEKRILDDELAVAEHFRTRRGFRVIEPMKATVPEIVAACAGARVVAGVEGSHWIHGILHLPPGGAVMTLQAPWRFCDLFKHLTDRDGQHFGFVVGTRVEEGGFRIDVDEVERTLDLFPSPRG
jgi:hypothetical protein